MSFIETTFNPCDIKVLTADSLPAPMPLTKTSILSTMPIFLQIFAMVSATLEAAKEVDFLVPLKPPLPKLN